MIQRSLFVAGCVALITAGVGCETAGLRVSAPPLPARPEVRNDLVSAKYVGMVGPREGRGIVAVELTNTSSEPITTSGGEGDPLPTKNDQRAWLIYRDSSDLKRFLKSDMTLDLEGPEATVGFRVPEARPVTLQPGESTTVLVGYALTPAAGELSFDLSPLVSSQATHDENGSLRALYLTVSMKDRPNPLQQAKNMINNTNFGIQLSSDDMMN